MIFYKNYQLYILNIKFGFKHLYIFISGYIINLSYRILYKLFDYGFIDLLIPITAESQLYLLSKNISIYLNSQYILSFILFSIFISLYFV